MLNRDLQSNACFRARGCKEMNGSSKGGYSARYSCRDRLTILLIDRGVGLRLSILLHEGKGLQVSSLTESFYF